MRTLPKRAALLAAAVTALQLVFGGSAMGQIDGLTGTTFYLNAKSDRITTPDGGNLLIWGYANSTARAQYPGPTLIVNEGDIVTIHLGNELDVPVSIVFPGQEGVSAVGGVQGTLTREARRGETVTYTFTAGNPGTYHYHSGTQPALEVEMGLFGAIIVRPALGTGYAYNDAATAFDYEYLFLLSEMDPRIHDLVETSGPEAVRQSDYLTDYFASYWFLNGRAGPDTLAEPGVAWLPTQPYNCMPRMHPGDKLLMRVIGGGRDLHPFHHHGNHARIVAVDGKFLESVPGLGAGPDLSYERFTIQSVPGETVDAIFQWTGEGLGWDMYGHAPGDALQPNEYAPDHGKPLPVTLPEGVDLAFGGFYSGSPFLGSPGALPPGEGGLNPNAGFSFMWHSHTEKELTNYNIFPGGLMSMLIIEPPGVPIP